jgi:malic enzyme
MFRGALDVRAGNINDMMLRDIADAIASRVDDDLRRGDLVAGDVTY